MIFDNQDDREKNWEESDGNGEWDDEESREWTKDLNILFICQWNEENWRIIEVLYVLFKVEFEEVFFRRLRRWRKEDYD